MIVLAPEFQRLHHLSLSEVEVDEIGLSQDPPDDITMNGITNAAIKPIMTSASSIFERVSKLSIFVSP